VEEPPDADSHGQQHQPKNLVTPEEATLLLALSDLGCLLKMRFDTGFYHDGLWSFRARATARPASV
jgi:hypothetical protein